MQTIQSIKAEISQLQKDNAKLDDWKKSEAKLKDAARKRIQLLKNCILYLETNPRPEFIVQMQKDCEHKLEVYTRRLKEFIASIPANQRERMKNPKTYYYKNFAKDEAKAIKDCKSQLRTVNHILS